MRTLYVHLGEDILVRTKDIVAILDKETVKSSQSMKELLESESNKIVPLTKGDFKSIVITVDAVYYSPLASGTLKKRSAKLAIQEF
ncbi:extracellular matrix regulator RemB [Robertmurraya kyonggiensis]|uniref:extracellular matrix regulator RemB n=1 Tax=Robertmurraya kyonggiensis TaxID=1037680 RepID=UPI0027BA8DF4|nr:extracellular matrix/biofilm biosynthesis regulator RemA family protein [Robertmurraya kyonggiensis]